MDIQETYRLWMQSPYFDEETKKELSQIAADTDEIDPWTKIPSAL